MSPAVGPDALAVRDVLCRAWERIGQWWEQVWDDHARPRCFADYPERADRHCCTRPKGHGGWHRCHMWGCKVTWPNDALAVALCDADEEG